MTAIIVAALFSGVFVTCCLWAWRAGKAEEKIKTKDAEKNALEMASHIRDRLQHDDDFAKRLRKRFSR